MIKCYFCGASNFVQPEFPPGSQMPCTKCGKEILVPFMLRNFEVRQAIASGGMGTVYRSFDTVLHRDVAVKVMKPELASDPKKLDEFYREAKAIAALNDPHIIQVFHFGEFEGQNFIAMEIADHGSLEDRINKNGKVSELEVLDVGIKIGAALDYALKQDLLHRDIKPANILYNAAGEPKLVDWGLAVKTDAASEWGSGEIWGTPEYVAPEKVRREGETFHADMYSLGATLYEALTGKPPFDCPTVQETVNAHVSQPVKPPKEIVPEISDATNDAIVKILAKKPKDRFANYDEMVMVLTGARSELLVGQLEVEGAPPEQAAQRKTGRLAHATGAAAGAVPPKKKTGLLVGLALAVVALAAAGYYFFVMKPGEETSAPPVPETNVVAQTNIAPPPGNVAATNPPALKPLPIIARPQITSPFLNLTDLKEGTNYWRAWGASKAFPTSTWKLQSGILSVVSTNRTSIVVKERYIDFELFFDWKVEPGTKAALTFALNEGIENPTGNAYRIPLNDDTEVQGGPTGRNAACSFSGLFGPNTNKVLKPLGQFNTTHLIVFKNKVEVWLNYRKVNEVNIDSQKFKDAVAKNTQLKERPYFGKTTSGYVGFSPSPGFTARNIRIRAIAEMPPPPKAPSGYIAPVAPKKTK